MLKDRVALVTEQVEVLKEIALTLAYGATVIINYNGLKKELLKF